MFVYRRKMVMSQILRKQKVTVFQTRISGKGIPKNHKDIVIEKNMLMTGIQALILKDQLFRLDVGGH